MTMYTEDRWQITDLMTGWIHRDLGEWDKLRELFHPDGEIEVTWFEGLAADFIEGSRRMGGSALKTKHLIGTPIVTFHGERAVVETNAVIVADNAALNLGCAVHNRFFDKVERRDGVWKLVKRQSIYDMGSFTFPNGIVEIEQAVVAKYPREYAALAYLLEKSGFPVGRVFATRGSENEKSMKAEARQWLSNAPAR
ncbi:nuclear transport factor 2 family protein [Paraburkholderia sp. CNPSo 3272]|uniref:nuclear transport factor 2 family protein n=1 Tax=Paraburkholderia sp. CNPSo 3272 TaxID=2940931 RepID=UPI0020B8AA01|nr:nuclear transport factor 2 family protein [Paraburkholderia sp. CNPSo 3272]MCP3727570.1 nuclear transport factor 2 family protein [Paraburkholderia sp. CNPSo 3272]